MGILFEVTGDDIAQLNDSDLRFVVGKLCEADYRNAGLPLTGIFWSGHQDAADGGFDVSVDSKESPPNSSFVLKPKTGFQVKKSKMPPSEIKKEMLIDGVLKEKIRMLLDAGGAYIIISSGDSTTKAKAYDSRIEEMKKAISSEAAIKSPEIDFYDRGRLATWAGQHPAVMIWIHERIGRSLYGWKPYGNWAKAQTSDDIYLVGEDVRLSWNSESYGMTEGIQKMRYCLNEGKSSLRLIGLSGVGKTRLVQALFDQRVGESALDSSLAIYTDTSDSPDPDPKHLIQQLIARNDSVIFVIDNCSRELHRSLSSMVADAPSKISLLTIEYDVREDLPEETSVFRLEPTNDQLLEHLLIREFPHLGNPNARSISKVSGGNFRVAIYLAKSVGKSESIGVLTDEDLFQRLFKQGHGHHEDLLDSAETLSLLYSFDGEDINEGNSELSMLADLAGKSLYEIHRDAQKILERELIQKRGRWRAILPHAVSNSLAKRALRKISPILILEKILRYGSERIITSFSRRLSYLHDSYEARAIVTTMLQEDGWLGRSITYLSSFGFSVLRNVAPVAPEALLDTVEKIGASDQAATFFSKENPHARGYVLILFHLAFEDRFFKRAALLMIRFAHSEGLDEYSSSVRKRLRTLFRIHLSGTHATASTRQTFLKQMIESSDHNTQGLNFELLRASLKTRCFTGSHEVDFGAHPRDYGSCPQSQEDIEAWFKPFIEIATTEAQKGPSSSLMAKKVMASAFDDLWRSGFQDECESWVDLILKRSSWVDGYRAVKSCLYYGRKKFSEESNKRLEALAVRLKPRALEDRLTYYVLDQYNPIFDAEDEFEGESRVSSVRISKIVRGIGVELGRSEEEFISLAKDCVRGEQGRFFELGKGLARSGADLDKTWVILKNAILATPEKERNVGTLRGFIWKALELDEDFYERALDDVMNDPSLRYWAVSLHRFSKGNHCSLTRLLRIIDEELTPIFMFGELSRGQRHKHFSDTKLIVLLDRILSKSGGDDIVLNILGMRFYGDETKPLDLSSEMSCFTRRYLQQFSIVSPGRKNDLRDNYLSRVIKFAFWGGDYYEDAKHLLSKILDEREYGIHIGDFDDSLNSIAETEPLALLDFWFRSDDRSEKLEQRLQFDETYKTTFLSHIDEELIFNWADENCAERYPRLAWHVQMIAGKREGEFQWNKLALEFLNRSDNLTRVLDVFIARLRPNSWSGSLADILTYRADMLEALPVDSVDKDRLKSKVIELRNSAQQERKSDAKLHRQEYQSFE